MKLKSILIITLCVSTIQQVNPKSVTVRLYKTDKKTWNTPLFYKLTTEKSLQPGLFSSAVSKTGTVIKSIKKDGKVVFDDSSDVVSLSICVDKECIQSIPVDLSQRQENQVVAIDKHGMPQWKTKADVDKLITASKPVVLRKIDVYKAGSHKTQWKITAIASDDGRPNPLVPYSSIMIKKDTSFAKKLEVPQNEDFFIVVNKGERDLPPQKIESAQLTAKLHLNHEGHVMVHGSALESEGEQQKEKEKEKEEAERLKKVTEGIQERELLSAKRQEKERQIQVAEGQILEVWDALTRAKSPSFKLFTADDKKEAGRLLIEAYRKVGKDTQHITAGKATQEEFIEAVGLFIAAKENELKRLERGLKRIQEADVSAFPAGAPRMHVQ